MDFSKVPRWKLVGFSIWLAMTITTLLFCSPSNNWPKTTASIIQVSAMPYATTAQRTPDEGTNYYYLCVYTFNGQHYTAQFNESISLKGNAKAHERNDTVPIYCDPQQPSKYQFERGPEGTEGGLVFFLLFVEAAALIWLVRAKI